LQDKEKWYFSLLPVKNFAAEYFSGPRELIAIFLKNIYINELEL